MFACNNLFYYQIIASSYRAELPLLLSSKTVFKNIQKKKKNWNIQLKIDTQLLNTSKSYHVIHIPDATESQVSLKLDLDCGVVRGSNWNGAMPSLDQLDWPGRGCHRHRRHSRSLVGLRSSRHSAWWGKTYILIRYIAL